jgi:uncharacterized membrane protein YdjX (TVP38/TMEM64 family)
MKKNVRFAIGGLVLAGLIVAAFLLPVRDWLQRALGWIDELGYWGPFALGLAYVAAAVLLVPGSILTLGAGFLFGLPVGFLTVWIASTLGAYAAFLVGRTVARDWVAAKMAKNEKFTAVDSAIGAQGFKLVLLMRLSPVFPYNLLNYALGLTNVSFRKYALATWLGMIPGILMYVYLGAGVRSLAEVAARAEGRGAAPLAQRIFFWAGLAIAVIVVILVTRIARRALRKAAPKAAQ